MKPKGYKIAIVGLGLMGGSLAFALRGFKDARIVGADTRPDVCGEAKRRGAVDEAYADAAPAMEGADLVIFCVYARHIPAIIESSRDVLRPGAVLADICGVKGGLYKELEGMLPAGTDYIGIHPMAGKERDGFENADPAIFKDTGFIICPLPSTRPQSIELMRELAGHIGATRACVSRADKHDEVIAYTSHLMHLAAAGLCLDYHGDVVPAFTGGAFRDCTRVANVNAEAWAGLLLDNRQNVLERLDIYMECLQKLRLCLAEGDEEGLRALLELAGGNKREMLSR